MPGAIFAAENNRHPEHPTLRGRTGPAFAARYITALGTILRRLAHVAELGAARNISVRLGTRADIGSSI